MTSFDKEVWLVTDEGNKKIPSSEVKKDDIILISEGNEILFAVSYTHLKCYFSMLFPASTHAAIPPGNL